MLEKITPEDLAGVGVIGLPDTPRLSTEEMQKKFEETAREVIIPKFNALVDALTGENGAGGIGAADPVTGENVTVQMALESLLKVTVQTVVQELTEAQKAAARGNIAALTWEADALDDAQKRQARSNIGAIGAAEIGEMGGTVSYAVQQDLTEEQMKQARMNIFVPSVMEVEEYLFRLLSGCWIAFTDEDGNPTDEPYIHWEQEV